MPAGQKVSVTFLLTDAECKDLDAALRKYGAGEITGLESHNLFATTNTAPPDPTIRRRWVALMDNPVLFFQIQGCEHWKDKVVV